MKTFITTIAFAFFLFTVSSCGIVHVHTPGTDVVVIKHRPAHYKVVHIKGKKYYHWNNNHYRKVRRGYILVRF
ncbi:MAG: hypothetical protein KGZ87_07130 [Bacteroidetes bacterium]|nr:hypothetical protein [Bacteroidota bacterium]